MDDLELVAFLDLPEASPNGDGRDPTETYIWVTRWEDFQHYRPERDRAPAWIKTYTKQLDDDRYLRLTWPQRAILHDIRSAFAAAHGRLTSEPRALSQRLRGRITSAQLDALNHAGFIEFCSRQTLDQRLDQLYSPPRTRVEVEEEEDKEPPNPRRRGGLKPSTKNTNTTCPDCDLGGGHHLADCPQVRLPTTDKAPT